jgi:pimeloyl-ACP methyl ester carboxylesterase
VDSNFVLAGHSLGGFLSARYAMKYSNTGGGSMGSMGEEYAVSLLVCISV